MMFLEVLVSKDYLYWRLNKLFRCICYKILWRRGLGNVCAWRILLLKFGVVEWVGQFWGCWPVGRILLGHDESGLVTALKSLVGLRWREFHCLAASPLALWIEHGL